MFKTYLMKRNKFQCPHCLADFEVHSFWKWLLCPHLFDIWRYVRCPVCGKRLWMKRVKKHGYKT